MTGPTADSARRLLGRDHEVTRTRAANHEAMTAELDR